MGRELKVSVADEEGARVVSVSGELDMDSSPGLLRTMKDEIAGAASFFLDLSAVEYIDSSGIAVLIQGKKVALKAGVRYVLRSPSAQVMSVIELSQLGEFFEFETESA